jgi:hypothetical protein
MAKKGVKTVTRYVAKPRRHRKTSFTIPLAVVGGMVPTAVDVLETYKAQGLPGGAKMLVMRTTGYNMWAKNWYLQELLRGMGPVLLGLLVHKAASKLGINRAIARAGIPFVRI